MTKGRSSGVAVIFTSVRSGADPQGYAAAAAAMEALAARQPGYAGLESVRGADGAGITISYWDDEASAIRWRDHPEHVHIRERGRECWYDRYSVTVAQVTRGYRWERA